MLKTSFAFMFVSSFMALFPVANPVGAGFIVNGFLSGLDEDERKVVVRKIAIYYLAIGIGSLAVGHLVLSLFSLSLPVVQLGGGLLICKTALECLSDSGSTPGMQSGAVSVAKPNDESLLNSLKSKIFFPLTFPMSIGPGSISVILTLMASASIKGNWPKSILNYVIIAAAIALMCLILYLFLTQGQRLMKRLGTSGNMIINKMVAFFTFCVGIQIVLSGVELIFHLNLGIS